MFRALRFSLGICVLVKQHTVCLTRYLSHNELFHSQETQTLTNFREKQDILTVRDQSIFPVGEETPQLLEHSVFLVPRSKKDRSVKKERRKRRSDMMPR